MNQKNKLDLAWKEIDAYDIGEIVTKYNNW
jgi:hypothetical protein